MLLSSNTTGRTGLQDLGEDGVKALGDHCTNLEILLLGGCLKIGDKCLLSITRGCKKLRILGLGRCHLLSNEGITEIAALPKLEKLNLSCCPAVDNESLIAIGNGCRSLTTIHLSGCMNIEEKGLVALLDGCPFIVELDVSKCRLPDKLISQIEERFPYVNLLL